MPTPRLLSVLCRRYSKEFPKSQKHRRNRNLQATVIVHILGKPYISFQHSICRNIDLPTCRHSDSSFERLIRALYIQRLNIVWIISRKISTGVSRTRDFFHSPRKILGIGKCPAICSVVKILFPHSYGTTGTLTTKIGSHTRRSRLKQIRSLFFPHELNTRSFFRSDLIVNSLIHRPLSASSVYSPKEHLLRLGLK